MEAAESAVLRSLPLWSGVADEVLEQCLAWMQVHRYLQGDCLDNSEQIAFAVVLSGSFSARRTAKPPASALRSRLSSTVSSGHNCELSTEVRRLYTGDTFGETAWDASCYVSRETSTLAVVNREEWETIKQLITHHKTLEKVTFFRSLPLFSGWSRSLLYKFSSVVRSVHYRKHDVIYREKDPATEVFFLVTGEVVITVKLDVQETLARSASPRKRGRDVYGQVCVKQEKEMLGFEGEAVHTNSCVCLSKRAVCYAVKRSEFDKRLAQHTEMWQRLTGEKEAAALWQRGRVRSLRNAEILKMTGVPQDEGSPEVPVSPKQVPVAVSPRKQAPVSPKAFLFITTEEDLKDTSVSQELADTPLLVPTLDINTCETLRLLPELPSSALPKKSLSPRNFFATPQAAVKAKYGNRDLIMRDFGRRSGGWRGLSSGEESKGIGVKVVRRSRHHMFRLGESKG